MSGIDICLLLGLWVAMWVKQGGCLQVVIWGLLRLGYDVWVIISIYMDIVSDYANLGNLFVNA